MMEDAISTADIKKAVSSSLKIVTNKKMHQILKTTETLIFERCDIVKYNLGAFQNIFHM